MDVLENFSNKQNTTTVNTEVAEETSSFQQNFTNGLIDTSKRQVRFEKCFLSVVLPYTIR